MRNKEDTLVKKMTLEEYENKYNAKPRYFRTIKGFMFIFIASLGIIISTCLFFFVMRLFDINKVCGYIGICLALIILIVVYVIPVIKINKSKAFVTTVNYTNAKEAKKYNKKMREEIADKIIDFSSKVENIGWYSDSNVGKLAIARHTKNEEELKEVLTTIYNTDVKKASNRLIRDHALRVGLTTALSQSEKLDTLFVGIYEINLIKELVMLYGYRPTDQELVRIYKSVINNTLIAYGLNAATSGIATGVAKNFGSALSKTPIASLIGTAIESASQGLINASLTVMIGYQTKTYLKKEYKLQDILDGVIIEDDVDSQKELIKEIKSEMMKKEKKDSEVNE